MKTALKVLCAALMLTGASPLLADNSLSIFFGNSNSDRTTGDTTIAATIRNTTPYTVGVQNVNVTSTATFDGMVTVLDPNNCTGAVLPAHASCQIMVSFNPPDPDTMTDAQSAEWFMDLMAGTMNSSVTLSAVSENSPQPAPTIASMNFQWIGVNPSNNFMTWYHDNAPIQPMNVPFTPDPNITVAIVPIDLTDNTDYNVQITNPQAGSQDSMVLKGAGIVWAKSGETPMCIMSTANCDNGDNIPAGGVCNASFHYPTIQCGSGEQSTSLASNIMKMMKKSQYSNLLDQDYAFFGVDMSLLESHNKTPAGDDTITNFYEVLNFTMPMAEESNSR